MPIGFPSTPADNDPYPVIDPVWRYSTAAGAWIPIASSGDVIDLRLTSLTATDDFIALRDISGTPTAHLVAASVVGAYGGGASAPDVMVAGDWTLTPIAGGFTFDIDVAPSNGGSAITGYEYSTDNGSSWAALSGGAALGTRDVTGLSVISYSCRVRAVNAIGAAPDPGSDTKTGTPLAGGATYIEFATLSGMTAGGAAGATRTYTGSAADGTAGGPDWNLPLGTAGGFAVDTTPGGSAPMLGLYTSASGAWDSGFLILMYVSGLNWVLEGGPGFTNLATTPRTHTAGDIARIRYSDTGNTYLVEIARAADPATWLTLGTGTYARSGTLYPRLSSFGAAGAVFTAPRVAP